MQFIKVHCTVNAKNAIKCTLKKKRLSTRREKDLLAKTKYHDDPEKKRQAVKKRNHDKDESVRVYSKEKYLNDQTSKITNQKAKYQENPKVHLP